MSLPDSAKMAKQMAITHIVLKSPLKYSKDAPKFGPPLAKLLTDLLPPNRPILTDIANEVEEALIAGNARAHQTRD